MNSAIAKPRLAIALLALAGALVGSLWVSTARSEAATVNCGTFTVLHNDRIGDLSLPKGKYTVNVINGDLLSCSQATTNFRNFLWDYDGVLPRPWRYTVLGVGKGRFFQSTNKQVGFAVRRGASPAPTPGPTPTPSNFVRCPGTFRVLNNDRIGSLILPKGPYYIYSSTSGPSCSGASDLFRQFLNFPAGNLPRPWKLKGATFTNPNGTSFRVKQAF